MQTKHLFLMPALAFFACAGLHAQVTIGDLTEPAAGALLDLNSINKGGLVLSNVTIADLDLIPTGNPDVFPGIIPATADENLALRGAMVYNDGQNPAVPGGIYIWNGYRWTKDGRFTPAEIPEGTGTLKGRPCFDVAETNNDERSGKLLMRQNITTGTAKPADFSQAGSNTQVYTFTPSGTASNIRFYAVEDSQYGGKIVESLTPDGANPNKVTLVYKSNLNNTAGGKYNTEALKVDIYAVYNTVQEGMDIERAVKLTASIQDCQCCGAYTADGWLNFMCHNLGANGNLDPFTWVSSGDNVSYDIKGDVYQWGRYTDGHEVRSTAYVTSGHPSVAQYNEAVAAYKSSGGSTAIPYNKPYTYHNEYYDWVTDTSPDTPAGKSRWGDGTTGANPPKGPNDPCPAGWKVPSAIQWWSIFRLNPADAAEKTGYSPSVSDANTWNWTTSGYEVGDALFLPAAGHYDSLGQLYNTGTEAAYWSSTWHSLRYANMLYFNNTDVVPHNTNCSRTDSYSVRCVSE